MKTIYLLAAISLVGVKLINAAPALSCENESDPDSGINGNWCGCTDGSCWELNPTPPYGCNPPSSLQITCPP